MKNFELISFPNDHDLAQAAASAWLDEVEVATGRGLTQFVALSGGRIARNFFTSVAELAKADRVPMNLVHFFWADERCVPPDDAESNFRMARELLFQPLGITHDKIHRVRGEHAPDIAANEAEKELCALATSNPTGRPVLDWIFLGMGEDGHVASLFPGEPETDMTNPAVYRPVVASKPPPNRVTISYAALAAARHVWVLASGAGKVAALQQSLDPKGQTPLARVLQSRAHTRIFTDIQLD